MVFLKVAGLAALAAYALVGLHGDPFDFRSWAFFFAVLAGYSMVAYALCGAWTSQGRWAYAIGTLAVSTVGMALLA